MKRRWWYLLGEDVLCCR